jgi:hypothetical protein
VNELQVSIQHGLSRVDLHVVGAGEGAGVMIGSTGASVGFLVGFGVTGESVGIGVVHTSTNSQLAKLPKTERQQAIISA